ncbi:MAG: glycosyltransferase [Thermodesulfobacteriota bacterium]|nr:glycosyltransferase [Thermodesulfobacteriota bacterium]
MGYAYLKIWVKERMRKMTDGRISVVIPVKNEEEKIEECLKAVLSQSIEPCEVIVVDGHSSDGTVEKASEFPVKVLYEEYSAVGGARQVGVENAEGEYVAFTDADCIPGQDWLENLIKEFDDGIVGVGGGTKNIGEGLWKKSISLALDTFLGSANSVQDRAVGEKRFVKSISGCNSIYRKGDLIKIGGYNVGLSMNEETELNKRLAKLGKLLYTPDAIILHNQDRDLKDFSKRMYLFGRGRGENKLFDLQVLPPILIVCAIPLLFLEPLVFLSGTLLYGAILLFFDFKIFLKTKKFQYLFTVPIVFMIEHLSYTAGFWSGVFRLGGKA